MVKKTQNILFMKHNHPWLLNALFPVSYETQT